MAKRILAMQESDLRMNGDLAMNIQRVLPVTQADIDAAAAVGQGWVVEQVFEVALPIDNTVGQTWRVIKVNSITPGQNVKRVMIVPNPYQRTVVVSGIPPLSLVGAVADSLTSLKAFGGTKENYGIPTEYTQVDYAIKKGTAGVQGKFDTGIKPTVDDVKIEMKVKIGDEAQASGQTTVGSFYACQARATASSEITGISGSSASGSINGMQNGQSVASGIVRVKDHVDLIRYEYKNGNHSIYVKDLTTNTEDTQTGTYTFAAPTKNLYIFGNTTTTNNLNNNNTLYYCKIWVSGSLAFDAVPVIRNSDNKVGLYDKVSQTFIEPIITEGGGFEAGDITTPTPSDPMDIYCNNGKIKVLSHTALPNDWNIIENPSLQSGQGMFISTEGKFQKANDRGAGVIIPVTVGKKYTVTINKKSIALGTIIRYGQSNNGNVPNSAEQLLDWYRGTITDGMMISFTAKRPYFVMQLGADFVEAGGIDEAIEVIEAAGDNETVAITTKNIYNPANDIVGKYIGSSGNIQTADTGVYQMISNVEVGKTYTFSTTYTRNATSNTRIYAYKSDNTSNGELAYKQNTTPNSYSLTFTIPADTAYIGVSHNRYDTETQVEVGSTKTAYVAYNDSTATANNLFAVSTYKDVQEIITGATTHNCGILVLNGTENWIEQGGHYVYQDNSAIRLASDVGGFCNYFTVKDFSLSESSTCIMWATNNIRVVSPEATVADFKTWLASHPVIMVYARNTPFEEVAPIAQAMNVVDGDNTVSLTQQGMSPLEVSATYTAGVSVTITEIENANIGNDVDVVIA